MVKHVVFFRLLDEAEGNTYIGIIFIIPSSKTMV